jgi:hypothetical protein
MEQPEDREQSGTTRVKKPPTCNWWKAQLTAMEM